jgi:proline iminopeptidase
LSVLKAAPVAAFSFQKPRVAAFVLSALTEKENQAMQPSGACVTMEDGARLFVQTLGTGPQTVVILNGFYLFNDFSQLADGRTLIFCDLRNRGRSDHITDPSQLSRGVEQDVDDLEAVRRHLGVNQVDLIAHSYAGIVVTLYAMKYPAHVTRAVQLGPMPPNQRTQYPAHLMCADRTLLEFLTKAAQLEQQRSSEDPSSFCRKFWSLLRVIYVVNAADADRITWARCELPTELNFMKYWIGNVLPSIHRLHFTTADLAAVTTPMLIVHGVQDRSAPYGGGRDWALMLPNARLVTVDHAAHAPWIENPDKVFGAITTFLDGAWPESAERVDSLEPRRPA